MFGKILYDFTRAFSSGVTLAKIAIRKVLANLYITNQRPSSEDTPLIYGGDYPHLYPQAYGNYLDILANAFRIERNVGEEDEDFRRRILFSIGQNSTKEGIIRSLKRLFEFYGFPVEVSVENNINNVFDGTSTSFDAPIRDVKGTLLYGVHVTISVPVFDGSRPEIDESNNVIQRKVSTYDRATNMMVDHVYPLGVRWNRSANIYLDRTVQAFRMASPRELVQSLAAAGILVDKVIIVESGAGGSKALT